MREVEDICLRQWVGASATGVWQTLIRPQLWWDADIVLEPRLGGRFIEPWSEGGTDRLTLGEVVAFEPPRLLGLNWKDEDWSFETVVEITLSEVGAQTQLVLHHRGWDAAPAAERASLIESHRRGWQRHLRNLSACAEAERTTQEEEQS